jgi:WD40-like Beta Propeller Repeat
MKRKDAGHPDGLAQGDEATDRMIRRAYEENTAGVDAGDLSQSLQVRLASARRRSRRRPAALKLAAAGACLILTVGLGLGVWQAVEHLSGGHEIIALGDAGEQTPSSTEGSDVLANRGGAAFSSVEPRSVTELKLADLWGKAAKTLGFDESTASLSSINISWGADGLLGSFVLVAVTPDERAVSLFFQSPTGGGEGETAIFTGSMGRLDSPEFATSLSEGGAVLMTVDQVLADLDSAGLMEIGSQSGVNVAGDPAALWRAEMDSSGAQGVGSPDPFRTVGPDRVLWYLSGGGSGPISDAEQATARFGMDTQAAVVLDVSSEGVDRLDAGQLPASLFPALGLDIGREFLGESGNQVNVSSGASQTVVLLHASSPAGTVPGSGTEALPVDGQLDGLAFATSDGRICRIQDGETKTLATMDTKYAGDNGSYGVSYSLGQKWVLWAGGITQVTLNASDSGAPFDVIGGRASNSQGSGGDSAGQSWNATSSGEAAIMMLSPTEAGASQQLLRTKQLSRMDRFEYDENSDRIWLAEPDAQFGEATLWTAQPHTAALEPVKLGSSFGGDFAVSPDGSSIFYLGTEQSQAKATLRTGDQETGVKLGLAMAYSPVFSPDGSKICLVGSKSQDGVTSLWIYDIETDACAQVKSTEGWTPTYPAFSPDGQRVAFRDWRLSDTWTVNVDGGQLTRYALSIGEAPIAW